MGKDEKMIIYQVFTRLFGNNHNHCINNGNITENGCGKMADFTAKALNEINQRFSSVPFNLREANSLNQFVSIKYAIS